MDFAKTPKYNYLENKTLFVSQIKKFIYYTSRATLLQKKCFCGGGNLERVETKNWPCRLWKKYISNV